MTLNRTSTLLVALAAVACGQVGDEAEEAASTMVDPDATWEQTGDEMEDVTDEIADAVSPNDGIELESELDRQIDEIDDGVTTAWDDLTKKGLHEEGPLHDELTAIESSLATAREEVAAAAESGEESLARAGEDIQTELNELETRLDELGDRIASSG